MYCINCGNKIDFNNNFCTVCGSELSKINNNVSQKSNSSGLKTVSIVLGIVGIISAFTFLFSIFGLMLSIIGLILAIVVSKKENNVIGIVLNSIGLFLSVLIISFFVGLIIWVVDDGFKHEEGHYEYEYTNDEDYEIFKDIIDIY